MHAKVSVLPARLQGARRGRPALDEPARRLRDDRPAADRKHLLRRRLYGRPAAGAGQEGDFIFRLLPSLSPIRPRAAQDGGFRPIGGDSTGHSSPTLLQTML